MRKQDFNQSKSNTNYSSQSKQISKQKKFLERKIHKGLFIKLMIYLYEK